MNNAATKAAAKAVKESTESAVAAYGWKFEEALDQAIRETAGEWGCSRDAIVEAVGLVKPWG